ncbi:MAG: glutamate-1-semialdehyde 2,1-aminomutase [Deltaproteobacteria bacterium]|nr:glutamate-1-semialdehyde 2,1-aminomutase [Deltaproteobacteria bacterium]
MNTEKSAALYNEALQYLPGGVNSPVRAFRSVGGTPLFMKKGAGSRIIDEDDNEYIDYCMSWGPLILGHADAEVLRALRENAVNGTSFGTPHRFEVEMAKLVTGAYPSIEKVRFVNSGTEAVMSAVRLARGFTGRDKIIKCDGCYHGHADCMLVASGSGLATFGTPDSAGVTSGNAQDTLVVPYNDPEQLEACLKKNEGSVAAVIMEPVPCNYALLLPGIDYLKTVRGLCDRYGALLIFDEVINGFRVAWGGAQEYYGVRADLTTLGKIIGGGLPVGAYGGRRDIMSKIAPDGPVYQAGTLSGNPLAMAAGVATLKKLAETKAYASLREKAELLRRKLQPVLQQHAGRVLFQQLESIFCFYFTGAEEIKTLDEVKKCDMRLFAQYHRELLNRGIYLAPSGYEVGFLSLAHTAADIDRTVAAVVASLKAIL